MPNRRAKYTPPTSANTTMPPRDWVFSTHQNTSTEPTTATSAIVPLRRRWLAKAINIEKPPMQIVIPSSLGSWSSPR
jgi:hypothetical protein